MSYYIAHGFIKYTCLRVVQTLYCRLPEEEERATQMWQYNLTTDMTDLENKLRSTWNQKLARVSGHGKSAEEGLEQLGEVGM